MKNALIVLIVSLLLVAPMAIAQEQENKPLIMPDSAFYGIKTAFESVRMAFTFGNENKVAYGLELAEKRLREMQFTDNEETIKELNQERNRYLEQARERTEGLNEQIKEQVRERIPKDNLNLDEVPL